MNNRAYSVLTIKKMDEQSDFVYVEGVASTPKADRMDDIVEPMGAIFTTPMPLLWQHNHEAPVGHMTFAQPTKTGIPFEARLPRIVESGNLKNRVDEAIHSLKYQLVSAVSIGFRAFGNSVEMLKSGGRRFKEWEWLELSLVTIPANSDAVIQVVRSIDERYLAAIGHTSSVIESGGASSPAPTQGKRAISLSKYYRSKK